MGDSLPGVLKFPRAARSRTWLPRRDELVILLLAAGLIAYQLFATPRIGMADSGDFARLLTPAGLGPVAPRGESPYLAYFHAKYERTPNPVPVTPFFTSTTIFFQIATRAWTTLGRSGAFDVGMLAAEHAVVFLGGLWLVLVAVRPAGIGFRAVLGGLLLLVFTDPGYVAYLNSFYAESTAIAALAVATGCALLIVTGTTSSRVSLVGYYVAAALVISSKPVYAATAPALALLGGYLSSIGGKRRAQGGVILSAGLILVAVYGFARIPGEMGGQSSYVGVFMELLPHSPAPRQDLEALGLDPRFVGFIGTSPYQGDSPLNVPEVREVFNANVRPYTLPLFYLARPDRVYDAGRRSMTVALSTRVGRLGYYERSSGKPPLAKPPGVWSAIKESVIPHSFGLLIVFFAGTTALAVRRLVRSSPAVDRGVAALYLTMAFVAVEQFLVAVLTEGGPDLQKHLFMFNVAFDGCLIIVVMASLRSASAWWSERDRHDLARR